MRRAGGIIEESLVRKTFPTQGGGCRLQKRIMNHVPTNPPGFVFGRPHSSCNHRVYTLALDVLRFDGLSEQKPSRVCERATVNRPGHGLRRPRPINKRVTSIQVCCTTTSSAPHVCASRQTAPTTLTPNGRLERRVPMQSKVPRARLLSLTQALGDFRNVRQMACD